MILHNLETGNFIGAGGLGAKHNKRNVIIEIVRMIHIRKGRQRQSEEEDTNNNDAVDTFLLGLGISDEAFISAGLDATTLNDLKTNLTTLFTNTANVGTAGILSAIKKTDID